MTSADTVRSRVTRLGQIALAVADLERSVAFYGTALGLPLLFRAPPSLAFFDCGGVRLMLSAGAENQPPVPGTTALYMVVDDIHRAAAALRESGVALLGEPHVVARMPDHDLWMAEFKDPDGHALAFMSEVPRSSS